MKLLLKDLDTSKYAITINLPLTRIFEYVKEIRQQILSGVWSFFVFCLIVKVAYISYK